MVSLCRPCNSTDRNWKQLRVAQLKATESNEATERN